MSASTGVRVPVVEAIEADDFSQCGGSSHARAQIRVLAGEVGLDPAKLVWQYTFEPGGRYRSAQFAAHVTAGHMRRRRVRRDRAAVMAAAIVTVFAAVLFSLLGGADGDGGTPASAVRSSAGAMTAAPAVTVRLLAERNVWISARRVSDSAGDREETWQVLREFVAVGLREPRGSRNPAGKISIPAVGTTG